MTNDRDNGDGFDHGNTDEADAGREGILDPGESAPKRGKRGDYRVGYGRPPAEHQFPNQRSNRGGRKRGAKNYATLQREILNEQVVVVEGGNRRRMTRFEVAFRRIVEKAMKGDPKAFQTLVACKIIEGTEETVDHYKFTEEDRHVLDTLATRWKRRGETS